MLKTNRYVEHGVFVASIGYIIEVYDDQHYEVEFSDENGIIIALFSIHEDEIELAEKGKS